LVEPLEEARLLAERFVMKREYTDVPIAIWAGRKVPTADDGMLPEDEGPNLSNYPMAAKPTFYILDGTGTIRHILCGNLGRDEEELLSRTIEFLLKEHTNANPS
jgi:hypothetical protein